MITGYKEVGYWLLNAMSDNTSIPTQTVITVEDQISQAQKKHKCPLITQGYYTGVATVHAHTHTSVGKVHNFRCMMHKTYVYLVPTVVGSNSRISLATSR